MYLALVVVLGEELLGHLVKGCEGCSEVAEGNGVGSVLEPLGDSIEVLGDGFAEGGELCTEEFLSGGCLGFYGADIGFGCIVEITDYGCLLRCSGEGGVEVYAVVFLYPSHQGGACDIVLTGYEGEVAEFLVLSNGLHLCE